MLRSQSNRAKLLSDHCHSVPFPGTSVSFSHSFSTHFYLITFPLTPLLSPPPPPLLITHFSLLCFSPFLSLVLFPLLGLSLRSHLTITSSCRLFYLVLHFSSSTSLFPLCLFVDFVTATSVLSLLHMHNKLVSLTTFPFFTNICPHQSIPSVHFLMCSRRGEEMGEGGVSPVGSASASRNGLSDAAGPCYKLS